MGSSLLSALLSQARQGRLDSFSMVLAEQHLTRGEKERSTEWGRGTQGGTRRVPAILRAPADRLQTACRPQPGRDTPQGTPSSLCDRIPCVLRKNLSSSASPSPREHGSLGTLASDPRKTGGPACRACRG
jgi:hypothetical protein